MKIGSINKHTNFRGGRIIVKCNNHSRQKISLSVDEFLSADNKDIKKNIKTSALKNICEFLSNSSVNDAHRFAYFLNKTPGENNIIDLSYEQPILKLQNENKAYFVKAIKSLGEKGSKCTVVERGNEAIGWRNDAIII